MNYEICSIQWEYEDKLPEYLTRLEYDHLFHYSEVKDGVRMFPFITIYLLDGQSKKLYLGA